MTQSHLEETNVCVCGCGERVSLLWPWVVHRSRLSSRSLDDTQTTSSGWRSASTQVIFFNPASAGIMNRTFMPKWPCQNRLHPRVVGPEKKGKKSSSDEVSIKVRVGCAHNRLLLRGGCQRRPSVPGWLSPRRVLFQACVLQGYPFFRVDLSVSLTMNDIAITADFFFVVVARLMCTAFTVIRIKVN